jgi:N-acetylneuraminic acid mutarotase
MMRLFYYALFTASSLFLLYACTKSTSTTTITGNWVNRFDAEFSSRTEAVSFTIGDTAYIGTGYDGTNTLTDFWKFSVSATGTDFYWKQVASLPDAAARTSAVGFATSTKGYVATGKAADGATRLNDNWEYNPLTNAWTQKSNFGGSARYDAVGFAINDKGYIATGYDLNYNKDFWVYDPVADSWSQLPGFSGFKRAQAVAWVYQNKAYIVSGLDNTIYPNDFWMYDPATAAWKQLRSISNVSTDSYDDLYTSITRANGVGFIMGNFGYLATGQQGSLYKNCWQYDFSKDLWQQVTDFEGGTRTGAVGFSVHDRGFITSGNVSSQVFSDFWELHPLETYNAND